MSKLNEDYIEALSPRPMSNPEDKKKEITSIMEYQGIEEKEMQEALMNYEASLQMQHTKSERKRKRSYSGIQWFYCNKRIDYINSTERWLDSNCVFCAGEKINGIGKAEECEGFVSIIDSPLSNMRSRWLPDNVSLCDIGSYMDLIVFE